jgi:mannosyltransferase
MGSADDRRTERVILACIIALAAVLRLWRLGHQSFWLDEALTLGATDPPPPGVSFLTKLLWDVHGPLYTFIISLWRHAGSSEAWLRLPGALAGIVTVWLMYEWMRREAGRDAAIVGALLLAVSPFHVYYSQELRFYPLLTMLTVLSLLAFRVFVDRPGARNALLLGLSLALACLSHFMALFLCASFVVYLLFTGRARGPHLRYGLLAAATVLVIVSPWIYRELFYLRRIRMIDPGSRPVVYRLEEDRFPPLLSYPYALYAFAVGFSFGPDLRELHTFTSAGLLIRRHLAEIALVTVLFGGLAVNGLVRLHRRRRLGLVLSILAVTTALVTAAAVMRIKVLNARYLTIAFPAFIALVACGVPAGRRAGALAVGAACVVMLFSTASYLVIPRFARDDIRGAVRLISRDERAGDLILVPGMEPVVRWYYRGPRPVASIYAPLLDEERTRRRLAALAEGRRRVWYLRCRPWDTDADGDILRDLDDTMRPAGSWEFPGVTLYLFQSD